MIPSKPDLPFVLRTLQTLLTDKVGVPRAFLILAKTMHRVVVVGKDSPLAPHIPTLGISGAEALYINQEFWKENVRSEYDMHFVLLHELLHHILGDTGILRQRKDQKKAHDEDALEGISTDARINALIWDLMPLKNSQNFISTRMYQETGPSSILRPFVKHKNSDALRSLWEELYDNYGKELKSHEDILNALKLLYDHKKITVTLLGSHGIGNKEGHEKGDPEGIPLEEMPKEIRDAIVEEIAKVGGKEAGQYGNKFTRMITLLNEQKQIDRKVLQSYAVTHQLNKLRSMFPEKRRSRKPVPINPTNRDLLKMVINGYAPTLWNSSKTRQKKSEFGIAIYLDLSGSVYNVLPKIVRMIVSMKKEIGVIYGFSNEVYDHTISELRQGKLQTTGGTDFDCVADHLLENGFHNCVMITDGYASITRDRQAKIKKQVKKCAIILFGENDNSKNWFSQNYDTFYLDKIVN